MKQCTVCGISKPESEFGCRSPNSNKLSSKCRECASEYNRARYHKNLDESRRIQREYSRQKRSGGWNPVVPPERKIINAKRVVEFYRKNPNRQFAKSAVSEAVKRFERIVQNPHSSHRTRLPVLIKYPYCPMCGSPTPIKSLHGHHYRGYEKPLDVLFVCQKCHGAITAHENSAKLEGLPSVAGLARFVKEQRRISEQSSNSPQDSEQRQYNSLDENSK